MSWSATFPPCRPGDELDAKTAQCSPPLSDWSPEVRDQFDAAAEAAEVLALEGGIATDEQWVAVSLYGHSEAKGKGQGGGKNQVTIIVSRCDPPAPETVQMNVANQPSAQQLAQGLPAPAAAQPAPAQQPQEQPNG